MTKIGKKRDFFLKFLPKITVLLQVLHLFYVQTLLSDLFCNNNMLFIYTSENTSKQLK